MQDLNKIYGKGLDLVVVPGSFRPNGASGIVSGSQKGVGFSVARTSAGLYTVTFDEKWPAQVTGRKGPGLISFMAGLRARAAEPAVIAFGSVVSQANRTAQIRVFKAATAAVTPSGGALTVGKGFIPLDIAALREIASNDIQNLAAVGGILADNSVPDLYRVNAATDKALKVEWKANEVDEVAFPPIPLPPDLDASADVTVHLLISKSGNTDTAAVIDVQAWEGLGDTEMGGNTQALDVAADTLFEATRTLAAADITGHPGMLNLQLVPGAHANDIIRLHAAWVEYTRSGWSNSAITATTTGQVWALADLAADADNEVEFIAILQDNLEGG